MKKSKHQANTQQIEIEKTIKPRIPLWLISIGLGIWVYVVLTNYFETNFVGSDILEHYFSLKNYSSKFGFGNVLHVLSNLTSLLYALLIFFGAYSVGSKIFKLFKLQEISKLEEFILSVSSGLGIIIITIFSLGVFGLLYKWVVLSVVLVSCAYGIFSLIENSSKNEKPINKNQKRKTFFKGFEKLWIILAGFLGLVILTSCFCPEIFYDSLVYHIGKPNLWIQNHKIMPDKAMIIHNFYPGYVNVLYSIGLFFKDETVCKNIHFLFNILTCFVIYAMGKRFSTHRTGILAAVLFFTIPYTALLSYRSAVEMPLSFFETLSVFSILIWLDKNDRKWLVIAAINCGLGLGTKYTTFYALCAMSTALFINSIIDKKSFKESIKNIILFGMISIGAALPWYIYNLFYTGAPLYPYFIKYMGFIKPKMPGDPSTFLFSYHEWIKSFIDILKAPWTISMSQHEEAFLGPLVLIFLPLILLIKNKWKSMKYIFVYIVVYWLIWGNLNKMYFRYFIPVMPSICFICVYYFEEAGFKDYFKKLFYFIISIVMFYNIMFVVKLQKYTNDCFGIMLGLESRNDYMNTMRPTYPTPYYTAAEWINQNLPENSLIHMLGELRSYYIKRKVIMFDFSNYVPVIEWAQKAKNADELYKKVKSEGVTHFLYSVPEARRVTDTLHWEGNDLKIFSDFLRKYLVEVHHSSCDINFPEKGIFSLKRHDPAYWQKYSMNPRNNVFVYKVLSKEEALKPHNAPLNLFLDKELYSNARWEKIKNVVDEIKNTK